VVWRIAEERGWHDGRQLEFGEFISLCHAELSEALEIYRAKGDGAIRKIEEVHSNIVGTTKPHGIPIELGDVIMRILDYCETHGINMETALERKLLYNKKRSYRHGDKVI
jgi:NTP pyrophosphatase (non-canonical NTP hydrolase)